MEGRPPGEIFAHQRWDEFFPQVGYVMSRGQIAAETNCSADVASTHSLVRIWCGLPSLDPYPVVE
jgi:hypothetical protein